MKGKPYNFLSRTKEKKVANKFIYCCISIDILIDQKKKKPYLHAKIINNNSPMYFTVIELKNPAQLINGSHCFNLSPF